MNQLYLFCGVKSMEELINKMAQLSNYLVLTILFSIGVFAETPPEDIPEKQYSTTVGTLYPINVSSQLLYVCTQIIPKIFISDNPM